MQLRMWSTVERLAAKHRNRTVVVVSHADPIKAAVTYAQGVPLDLFQRTVISPCSVSAVVLTNGAPLVLVRQQHRIIEGLESVVNYVFSNPDKIMVGVRGEVGNRLFLLQVREGRRLVIVKCEKIQLAALAEWISQVLSELGRPGHLPEDFSLEPEYESRLHRGRDRRRPSTKRIRRSN